MAKRYGVRVDSYNISREQIVYARDWAKREGVAGKVTFVEDDYRNIVGKYDVFVSIGMLEHVGPGNYRGLGEVIDRCLKPDGRGLIHSIGRDRPALLNAWIRRRIFPGAHPPTLGEMAPIFEPSGLTIVDVENLKPHYAQTLKHWLERFEANKDTVRAMFDESFVRAWRLYLAGSTAAFTVGQLQLYQVLFIRSGRKPLPMTRDYVYMPPAPDKAG
jgi:cyclopropane-fatty-acyl-phospholipid synthase